MTRIIVQSNGGQQLEVEQSVFDAGFFPGYWYVRDAGPSASTEPAVLDGKVHDLVADGTSQTAAALRAALVPKWKPSTAYASGEFVLSPSGQIVSANTAFTSGATYNAANWTVIAGGSGTTLPTQTGNAGKFLTTDGSAVSWGTVSGGGGTTLTPTATKTGTYTAAVGDLAMMNVAGGATVLTLPTAPANKAQVGYRAIGATTAVPLTINRGGSTDTIGTAGATSASIPLADETVILQYDAPNTRWLAVANVRTQASVDARYQAATPTTILSTVTGTQSLTLPATSDAAYDLTLTGNTTLTLSGGTSGRMGTLTVVVRQDATAGRTVTFPAAVAWPGQTAPTLNVSAGKYDVLQLTTFDGGTTWIGALVAGAVQPVTAPSAPVSLAANPSTAQVILTWADAGNGGSPITGHKVYRGTTSGGETLLATLGNVVTYTDSTGLTNGTTYYYKVTAINALGESVQSAEVPSTPGHYLNVTTGGASTPYVAGMEPGAGTVDLRALVQMANWIPSGNQFVLSSWGSTALNNRYALYVDNAGKLNGAWYNAAGVFQGVASSVATNIPANGTKWIRALLNPTAGTCIYYLSDDGVTWTQLGTTVSGLTTTGVQTGGTAYTLTAGQTASASGQFAGRVYKAQLLVAAAAKAAVDYTTATAGASTVTGSQAEVWTTIAPAAVV